MPGTRKKSRRFAVGSMVRVKKNVVDPNNPELPIGGWLGTVSEVSGTLCLVQWSEATLVAFGRRRCGNDEKDRPATWLEETMLEADPGEPICVESKIRTA